MTFLIFDDGNLVASFETEAEASEALARLAEDPVAAQSLLLVAFDDNGEALANCAPGERLVIRA